MTMKNCARDNGADKWVSPVDTVLLTSGWILTMVPETASFDPGLLLATDDPDGLLLLGAVRGGVVAISGGRILHAGSLGVFEKKWGPLDGHFVEDLGRDLIMPGLIDCHTHMAFVGSRQREFLMRLRGTSYMEILERGGGIISSVRAVREASRGDIAAAMVRNLERHLAFGTTTCEIKSGYGLSTADEIKLLEAVAIAGRNHPVEVVPTFLGAHAFPPEYRDDRDGYVDLMVTETIPEVALRGLAEFCDVFCEKGVFTPAQSARVLMAAKGAGMGLKIHADEIVSYGGAELAAEVGAISAEHLLAVSDEGISMMAEAGVTAVLLPTTPLFLMKETYAPARKMIGRGVRVALATDFNPGSSMNQSLFLSMSVACLKMGMTPAEAIAGCTVNAAAALSLGHRLGAIAPGMDADVIALAAEDHLFIPYNLGGPEVTRVYKKGVRFL